MGSLTALEFKQDTHPKILLAFKHLWITARTGGLDAGLAPI